MLRQGNYKLITFGHTLPWFNATSYVDMLFDVTLDPFELTNIASQNPDIVKAMFTTLETEFGGQGSLAAIDSLQMTRNYQRFEAFFANNASKATLLKEFESTFGGLSEETLETLVYRWIWWMGNQTRGGPVARPIRQ
jgi:hypothetical protein